MTGNRYGQAYDVQQITHEPASISVRIRDIVGLSVVTLISVPVRTLLAVCVYSLPLRLRTTGG